MKCKSCEYPLWNLRERVCPECGAAFLPSDYDFNANAVAFACPHCAQVYYGTSPRGHIVPEHFDCLECGRLVHMNEMILCPAEGAEEMRLAEGLTPDRAENPWHVERGLRLWRAFFATMGRSIGAAPRLLETTPPDSSAPRALAWAALLGAASLTLGGVWCGCSPIMWAANSSGSSVPRMLIGVSVAFLLVPAWIFVYGFLAHAILRATGGSEHGLARSYQAVAYSAGPLVICAVPAIGGLLMLPAFVWWGVNAAGALRTAQRASLGRSTAAAITPMLVMIAGIVWLVAAVIWPTGGSAFSSSVPVAAPSFSQARTQIQTITSAMLADPSAWPAHPAELLGAGVTPADFVNDEIWPPQSGWKPMMGPHTPAELLSMSEDERAKAIQSLAAAPAAAYRVGDVVFCHQGLDRATVPGDLWIVVGAMDPSPTRGPVVTTYEIIVGQADGTSYPIPTAAFPARLRSQNIRRAQLGLPPLPDPTKLALPPGNPP